MGDEMRWWMVTADNGMAAEISAAGPNQAIDAFIDEAWDRNRVRISESDVTVRPLRYPDLEDGIPHGGDTLATDDPLGQIG